MLNAIFVWFMHKANPPLEQITVRDIHEICPTSFAAVTVPMGKV